GHVADPATSLDPLGIHLLTKQPGLAFRGRQQAGQDLHRCGLAAAVGPQEAKDFSAANPKTDTIDGGEVAKALGQVASLDSDDFLGIVIAWNDLHRLVQSPLFFWLQGDEGRLLGSRSVSFLEIARTTVRTDPSFI